jgi:hypothetical protein
MSRLPLAASFAAALLTATLPGAALGQTFNARNGMDVTPLGDGLFRVEFETRINETDYWCAAGDYAERVLGAPPKARLFRASPPPRKRGQGITFTLDAEKSAGATGVSSFGAGSAKDSLSVSHATGSFCQFYRFINDF